jgi:DNA-binding response OmpR family regulator
MLRQFGHDVEIAAGGKLGIQKFEGDNFELVITGIVMPDLDGESIAKHIRNCDKNFVWIIAMSGMPWRINRDYFDALLPKPFSMKDLLDCVDGLSP